MLNNQNTTQPVNDGSTDTGIDPAKVNDVINGPDTGGDGSRHVRPVYVVPPGELPLGDEQIQRGGPVDPNGPDVTDINPREIADPNDEKGPDHGR